MGEWGAGREAARSDGWFKPWEYSAAIFVLLGVAVLVMLSGCNGGRLNDADGRPEARPTPLQFGKVAVGSAGSARLEIRNEGNAPLLIEGIVAAPGMPTEFQLPRDAAGRTIPVAGKIDVAFGFSPSSETRYEGKILLHTDSHTTPQVEVSLTGQGARPLVQCNSRLDFGRQVLNQPRYLALTCINASSLEAEVRIVGVQGRDAALFQLGTNLTEDTITIPGGGNARIEVMYSAAYLGSAEADALLEVAGAEAPRLTVPMTGEAYASDFYAVPGTLDFGAVSPGTTRTLTVNLVNDGTTPVLVRDITLNDPDTVFASASLGTGIELEVPAKSQVPIEVSFKPRSLLEYAGSIDVVSSDDTNPHLQIQLRGRGGGAQMLVTPDRLDFGTVATGMMVTRQVLVSNVGTDEGDPLHIEAADIVGDPASFAVEGLMAPVDLKPGDDALVLTVRFRPLADGSFSGSLRITSNDGDTPEFLVPLTGEARELAPCSYVVEPNAVQFGAVGVGSHAVLAVSLRNVGGDDCVFSSVAMSSGSSAAFTLRDGPISLATVAPGDSLTVPVAYDAATEGESRGSIGFFVSDPVNPQGTVPVTGLAVKGCLVAEPGAIKFSTQRLACPMTSQQITLRNSCAGDAVISSVTLGVGNFSGTEIRLSAVPVITLRPGGTTTVTVWYDPEDEGVDSATVIVQSPVLKQPLSIPVAGEGTKSLQRIDRFQQKRNQPVDVLFVVDNSGSMMEEQQAIADGFDAFIRYAQGQKIDYHIGVTTTGISRSGGGWQACPGSVDGGEGGRLFPADSTSPRWVTPATPNAEAVFENNVKVGICHWWEEGLEGAYLALSPPLVNSADDPRPTSRNTYIGLENDGNLGFYRADAKLSVIIVTDEDDHSSRPASFYTAFFLGLKGAGNEDMVSVHGVLGDGCSTASGNGDKYREVIDATKGVVQSICTSDWDKLLASLAEETFGFSRRFPLSGRPEGAVQVTVDGVSVNGWTFDVPTNAVVFDAAATPGPGSIVEVTYTPACGT